MISPIALLLIKASAVLALALAGARLLRRESAGRRHFLWSAAFLALITLPALATVLPPIEVEALRQPAVTPIASTIQLSEEPVVPSPAVRAPAATSSAGLPTVQPAIQRMPTIRQAVFGVWALGFGAAVLILIVSLIRVQLLARRGELVRNPDWWTAAGRIAARFGFTRPIRLIASPGVTTPMAAGIVRPTVFLPADALEWPAERRDVVLAHEIAHLASRDPLRHLMGRAALTLYWFHPLAWIAASDATTACEQACDDAVLALGVRPSDYAQVLLDFAGGAPPAAPAAALPIVRRPLLETRLMAILDDSPRPSIRRRVIAPAAIGAVLTLSIAAVQPATSVTKPLAAAPAAAGIGNRESGIASTKLRVPTPKPAATASESRAPIPTSTVVISNTSAALDCSRDNWSGSQYTTNSRNGSNRVDRVVQKNFSDLRLCAAGEDVDESDARPSDWSGQRLVIMSDERNGDLRRLEVVRGVTAYSVNGRPAPFDADAQEWRRALLAVLDASAEASELRGRVSSLRGEISSTQGERSSLQGEISSLRGQVSSMQGEISSIRGQESSMRGEISSIRGNYSSLQGQISSEQGAISSLQGSRNDRYADQSAIDRAIRRHEEEIDRIRGEIARYDVEGRVREVERRIRDYDADGKVREMERRIQDFDVESRVADVQRRLAALNVDGQVKSIEGEISSLDADNRVAAIEARQNEALRVLRARLRR